MTGPIDISLPVGPDTMIWPGNPSVSVEPVNRLSRGDRSNVTLVCLGSHTGTHVDAPAHVVDGGATVDELPLDSMIGDVTVADVRGRAGPLRADDLAQLGLGDDVARLLLRSDSSELWHTREPRFPEGYVSVSHEGAAWLVARGIRLVGTDFLSIEARGTPGHPTHRTLLDAGVVVLEGLDLAGVEPGDYVLVCLPLRLVGCDGAPARAVLLERPGSARA